MSEPPESASAEVVLPEVPGHLIPAVWLTPGATFVRVVCSCGEFTQMDRAAKAQEVALGHLQEMQQKPKEAPEPVSGVPGASKDRPTPLLNQKLSSADLPWIRRGVGTQSHRSGLSKAEVEFIDRICKAAMDAMLTAKGSWARTLFMSMHDLTTYRIVAAALNLMNQRVTYTTLAQVIDSNPSAVMRYANAAEALFRSDPTIRGAARRIASEFNLGGLPGWMMEE